MLNISCKIFTLIISLVFLFSFKTGHAQILLQPEIGTITSINSGTDRIVEMLREEDEEENSSDEINEHLEEAPESLDEVNETPNESESTIVSEAELSQNIEEKSEDVEIFFPPSNVEVFYPHSKLNDKDNVKYSTKNIKDETINENVSSKNTSKKDVKELGKNLNYKIDSKNVTENKNNAKTRIITSMGGGLQKINTGNGGEIKNHISGMDIAWIREIKNPNSKMIVGGLVDYNHNSYDNEANGIKGSGKSDALMVGILAKHIGNNGFYYEGSARLGRAKTDFQSTNIYKAQYEESAPVYAGHARIGKIIDLNEQNEFDLYGTYSFAHQDRLKLRPSSNESYNLGSIDSNRLRAGCRMTTRVNDNGKIYYGLAYQYEADSKIKARQNGSVIDSSSGRGSSGLVELGYKLSTSKNKTSSIDLNAIGFSGRQKGFTIQAQFIKLI